MKTRINDTMRRQIGANALCLWATLFGGVPQLPAQLLSPGELSAQAAILVDRDTGNVLWSKNATEQRAMASTTKIMTALLVLEMVEASVAAHGTLTLNTQCRVNSTAVDAVYAACGCSESGPYGSAAVPPLEEGEYLTVSELLLAMLLPSDNLACYVLAETLAGSTTNFVTMMNSRARELGLHDTHFCSPNGFDDPDGRHHTTAYDLARLAEVAMEKSVFRWFVKMPTASISDRSLTNSNSFLHSSNGWYDPEVIGIKTGTTDAAGACLVAAAERDGLSLLTVVLGSDALRFTDTRKLLDHGWDLLSSVRETTSFASGDFDGDGYDDLAIGMPQATAAGASGAGKVALLKGSFGEIKTKTASPRTIVQGNGAIPSVPEAADGFGHSLAVGDFDRDGYDDLAIGVPWEDYDGKINAGMVAVVYGSAAGLNTGKAQGWHQDTSGVPGGGESYDAFGQSLAVGDFDGDGYDDLAIGIPGEDVEDRSAVDAGGVVILYGSQGGLSTSGSRYFQQSEPSSVPGAAESGDAFGWSLVAGRFDNDDYDDLAIGVPGEDVDGIEDAGMVCVIHGSSAGLDPDFRTLSITDDSFNASSFCEPGDMVGYALAAGDFNDDGIDDLAVGAPGENYQSVVDVGSVLVVYGAASGLTDTGSQHFYESTSGIGTSEYRDSFGAALAAGDFNGDGYAELAISITGEDSTVINEGAVVIIAGTSDGLNATVRCDRLGPNTSASESQIGGALCVGRFGPDGIADLAVGITAFFESGTWRRGAARIFDGESTGLSASRYRTCSGL
jgi:D-alanyl-D-alanine carboxypeptidase